jgi:hypothetical protein
VEDVLESFKIPSGKVSDIIWKNLTAKVWDKLSTVERCSFVSEVESREDRPKTFRDFYVFLMDYFLNSLENNNDRPTFVENESINKEIKLTI